MNAMITLVKAIVNQDFTDSTRTVESLGINGMNKHDIFEFVSRGK